MKKITTLLFLFVSFLSFAQSNLTIFNNNGQQFYVILNGIKQNSVPMTNVSVGGVKNGSYSVKLIFADGKTADIDKNFFIEEPMDITTRVVMKKGKGKLQLIGMEPTKGAPTQNNVIVYRPDNSAVYSDAPVVNQTVTTHQTNTTTSNTQGNDGTVTIQQSGNVQSGTSQTGTINMNVGVTETQNTTGVNQTMTVIDPSNPNGTVGMNININVQDPSMTSENINMSVNMNGVGSQTQTQSNTTNVGNTQVTQTTTTTVTTSGTDFNTNDPTPTTNTATPVPNSFSNVVTCKNILGDGNAFVEDVKSMTFDEDKKELIMKDLKNYCLTASQAYKIIETLSFEADRLEIAKYLYDRMIDKDSGKTLLPLFTFDSSKMEFREYIRK